MRRALALVGALALAAIACKKGDAPATGDASATPGSQPAAPGAKVVAEALPRCRAEPRDLAIAGEDVVAGDAVVFEGGIAIGVIRRDGGRPTASVVRAALDLASATVIDLGPALGDDPPPVPRMQGGELWVATTTRKKESVEAGIGAQGATREVRLARVDGKGQIHAVASITQQADESTAFDYTWPLEGGAGSPIVAWDEDAPIAAGQFLADHGTVKVQIVGQSEKRTIAPYATDAEHPRLLARPGGYWIAWLARRAETTGEDAGYVPEGPAESRAFRWVELAKLDANGEREGPIRRITPEKGRVASFELAHGGEGSADVVIVAQDEAAGRDGAGARVVRYAVRADAAEAADLVDAGVGHAPFELVRAGGGGGADAGASWLSWTDGTEHAHLLPLTAPLSPFGPATVERALDRARLVAARDKTLFAVASEGGEGGGRVVLRRLSCP